MVFSLQNLGELDHHFIALPLMCDLIFCLAVEKLVGRRWCRKGGRDSRGLESWTAAFLASLSALSLPFEFMWLATQVNDMVVVPKGVPPCWGPG